MRFPNFFGTFLLEIIDRNLYCFSSIEKTTITKKNNRK